MLRQGKSVPRCVVADHLVADHLAAVRAVACLREFRHPSIGHGRCRFSKAACTLESR